MTGKILGNDFSKEHNIASIISSSEDTNPSGFLMIGDGFDDYKASIASGIDFFGVTGGSLEKQYIDLLTLYSELSTLIRLIR